jgi:hypothetical protein
MQLEQERDQQPGSEGQAVAEWKSTNSTTTAKPEQQLQ